jgi:coenzyme F420-0:L-glutamate ligase / coenzyme F420-1:gamma-L-glutamate ligase
VKRSNAVEILAVPSIPLVRKDDDLVALIGEGLARGGIVPHGGDVFVLTQKIVSKAEGRMVDLATVEPSTEAIELAANVQKDPRLVELILSESVRVVRARPGILIVEHRLGLVMANAGSAAILRRRLSQRFGVPVAVIISDSFGRAWRRGTCGVAIGAAGLPSLMDLRGSPDLFGRELQVSITGHADEIAAAASLVMGQGAEGQPVVIVRGLTWRGPDNGASELVRPAAEDMFR